MKNQCQHLTETRRNELMKLLQNFEECFDGTLGTCKHPVEFELKEDAKAICSRPYPVLNVYEIMFKKKFKCLVLLGVLTVVNDP